MTPLEATSPISHSAPATPASLLSLKSLNTPPTLPRACHFFPRCLHGLCPQASTRVAGKPPRTTLLTGAGAHPSQPWFQVSLQFLSHLCWYSQVRT